MANKTDLLRKIRMFCSECMGGPRTHKGVWPIENPSEVAGCVAERWCIFFPYRFATDPDKDPRNVERGKALAEMGRKAIEEKKRTASSQTKKS